MQLCAIKLLMFVVVICSVSARPDYLKEAEAKEINENAQKLINAKNDPKLKFTTKHVSYGIYKVVSVLEKDTSNKQLFHNFMHAFFFFEFL